MATLVSQYSLAEQAKRIDPDGKLSTIVECLNREMGDILTEVPWLPSNDMWTHKTTRRASLPSGAWRKLNAGIPTEVSRVSEILDVIGMLGTYAEYDKKYIDSMPSPAQSRMMEAQAFIEGLGQTLVSAIIYGNSNTDPDTMHGLAPRLTTVDGRFIINAGGSGGDTTSIYVVTWGPAGVHLLYPKNSPSLGITHQDLGEVTISTATTGAASTAQFQGYRDYFEVMCGMVVRDQKCLGRIGNIEISGASNLFDEDDLITLLNNMKTGPSTRIYCNQMIKTQAQIRMKDKGNIWWTGGKGLSGEDFFEFAGVPVKKIDQEILLNTETAIS